MTFRPTSSISLRLAAMATALAIALFALPVAAPGTAQAAEKIAVLVNDEPISDFDIAQRARLLKLTGVKGNTTTKATQELIEERLKLQEAKRLGITVSDDDINGALQKIATNTRTGTVSRLAQALSANGINIRTLKDRFRAQIAWSDVVRRRFRSEVRISDADILAALKGKDEKSDVEKTVEYDLSRVIVVVPAKASNALIAERKRTAEKIKQNVTSCSNLRSVASAFRDVTVQDIGSRNANQLPEDMQKLLASIPVGRTSAPNKIDAGYEMIVVCDKSEISGFAAARSPMETELRNEQGMILARRLLRDLRADALIEYR
ncbi:MAG: SurA N-terminal domain-containing protein [Rhodobiaceae bacterium]|nr:SurA N-terminal domain-containing protein [Rhodobiaceae bacterium]